VHGGGDDGAGYFVVKIWADAAKLTDMLVYLVAGFRQSRYLVRKGDMFVENKAKVTNRVSCVTVSSKKQLILASCCLSSMRINSVLEELRDLQSLREKR